MEAADAHAHFLRFLATASAALIFGSCASATGDSAGWQARTTASAQEITGSTTAETVLEPGSPRRLVYDVEKSLSDGRRETFEITFFFDDHPAPASSEFAITVTAAGVIRTLRSPVRIGRMRVVGQNGTRPSECAIKLAPEFLRHGLLEACRAAAQARNGAPPSDGDLLDVELAGAALFSLTQLCDDARVVTPLVDGVAERPGWWRVLFAGPKLTLSFDFEAARPLDPEHERWALPISLTVFGQETLRGVLIAVQPVGALAELGGIAGLVLESSQDPSRKVHIGLHHAP